MHRGLLAMLAAPGLVLVMAACDSSTTTSTSTTSPSAAAAASNCPSVAPGSGTNIAITATDFCFSPSTLNLAAGKPVNVTFVNAGSRQHNLTMGGQDLGSAQAGETKTFTYTPTAGANQYFCKFHKDSNGMVGTLSVIGSGGAAPSTSAPAAAPTKSYNPYGY